MERILGRQAHAWLHEIKFKYAMTIALTLAAATALFSLTLPNTFRSSMKIMPMDTRGGGGGAGLSAAAAALGMPLPGQDGIETNYVDIINSRSMAEFLLSKKYKFTIKKRYLSKPQDLDCTLETYLRIPDNPDRAVAKVKEMIGASRDPKSRILSVTAETPSPELSQQLVQNMGAFLEQFVMSKSRTRGGAKAAFAEARVQEARREMVQAEEALRRFLEVNRNFQVSPDPSVRLLGGRLDAELQLRQKLLVNLAMSREQALLEEKNDLPILNILDPANLPSQKARPSRGAMVLASFVLGLGGTLAWSNRSWLKARFLEPEA